MRVFISWSGEGMLRVAEALYDWIPCILHSIEPWVSSQDIATGSRSMGVLAEELERAKIGIVCISRRTQHAPWINFEAGALSKILDEGRVIPFLVDLVAAELDGPMKQFQAVEARNKSHVARMLHAINSESDHPIKAELLDKGLGAFWQELLDQLNRIVNQMTIADERPDTEDQPRPQRDMVAECLVLLREQQKTIDTLGSRLDSIERAIPLTTQVNNYTVKNENSAIGVLIKAIRGLIDMHYAGVHCQVGFDDIENTLLITIDDFSDLSPILVSSFKSLSRGRRICVFMKEHGYIFQDGDYLEP